MRFEWDPSKAASNAKKHKVTFEVAKTVFYDDFAVQFFDEEHSSEEERFLLLGMSSDAPRARMVVASLDLVSLVQEHT